LDRAYALRSVRLILQLERGKPSSIEVRPATPTQNREVLLKLLSLQLQAHPPQAGILTVTLDAEPAQPQTSQRGLFQAQFPERDKLELLLARLRSIAGEDNVGSPQLQNSHNKDAFTMKPFRPTQHVDSGDKPLSSRLAVRMFRPPQPVRVSCRGASPAPCSGRATLRDRIVCRPVALFRFVVERASMGSQLMGRGHGRAFASPAPSSGQHFKGMVRGGAL